mgnify:FL=1
MQKRAITIEHMQQFQRRLQREERSAGTIENYLRHLRQFAAFLDGGPVTKERTRAWKDHRHPAPRYRQKAAPMGGKNTHRNRPPDVFSAGLVCCAPI